ncbi:MAG: sulfite exporter TauE/SafE family protein, partial [Acidimicrobiales bacterium]
MTLLTIVELNPGRDTLLVVAGFAAGIFNGVAGGGTLISFPLLLALGYPALTANVTSTVGIWPGYLGGIAGFRREISEQRDRFFVLAPLTIVGATVGAILLLTTPSSAFTRLAPWLVLFASALFAVGPLLNRWLAGEDGAARTRPIALWAGMFVAAVYGGYFGAAMGVIILA